MKARLSSICILVSLMLMILLLSACRSSTDSLQDDLTENVTAPLELPTSTITPEPLISEVPTVTVNPDVVTEAPINTVTPEPTQEAVPTKKPSSAVDLNVGDTFTLDGNTYEILSSADKTVTLLETTQSKGDFIVPSEAVYNQVSYRVTQVGGIINIVNGYDGDEDRNYVFYEGSFAGKEFSSITIPKSVTKIADYAFNTVINVRKITINSDDITIGKYAFSIAGIGYSDRSLTINAKKITLLEGALAYLTMSSIQINADELSIGDYALAGPPKGIKLPQGTTYIGNHALEGGYGAFTIPKSVKFIGDSAFGEMKLTLEKGNPHFKISDGILYNAEGTEIIQAFDLSGVFVIPSSVTSIRKYAFAYSKVIDITISGNIKSIPAYAFYECFDLASVTIGEGVKIINEYAFALNDNLKNVIFPASLQTIGDYAFFNDMKLTSLVLPDTLQSIGTYAFLRTSIKEVKIPAAVTSIGKEAFRHYELYTKRQAVNISFEEGNPVYEQKGNIVYQKGTSTILIMILDPSSDKVEFPEGIKDTKDIDLINYHDEMEINY